MRAHAPREDRSVRPTASRGGPGVGTRRSALSPARGRPGRGPLPERGARAVPGDDDVGGRPARRVVRVRRAQGVVRINRRGGRVGRPALARHRVQPASPRPGGAERHQRAVGARQGRDGRHLAGPGQEHEREGATIRTGASVASIDVRDGRVTGVTLESGEQLRAPVVASGAHPKTTILDLAGAEHFPDDVASRHAPLPQPWRLGEGQLRALRAPALRGRLGRGRRAAEAHQPRPVPIDRLPGAGLAGRGARRAGRLAVRGGRGAQLRRPPHSPTTAPAS